MENTGFEEVYSKNVIEFVTIVNEFCAFLEKVNQLTRVEIVEKTQKFLPLLYLKGSLLPTIESVYDEANEKFVTETDYNYIYRNLQEKLARFDDYLEVFDIRMNESETPVVASVSENLADIYQDVKDFLMLYRVGTNEIMNDAIWECKNNFEEYWGQKALNSLRAIHNLLYKENIEDADDEEGTTNFNEKNIDTSSWFISKKQKDFREGK